MDQLVSKCRYIFRARPMVMPIAISSTHDGDNSSPHGTSSAGSSDRRLRRGTELSQTRRRRTVPATRTAPLPETTASANVPGGDAQRFVMGQDVAFKWWEAFGSPGFQLAGGAGLSREPDHHGRASGAPAGAGVGLCAAGLFYPSVSADYNFERQKSRREPEAAAAPGRARQRTRIIAPQNPPPPPPYNEPLYFNFQTAQLTVGFTPDVFGSNRRKVESLDAQAQMQRFELEATYVTLASNVVAAAIQEASLRGANRGDQGNHRAQREIAEILRDKFKLGFCHAHRRGRCRRQQLAQAKALLPPLEKQFEQNRDLIRALVGNLPNQEVERNL